MGKKVQSPIAVKQMKEKYKTIRERTFSQISTIKNELEEEIIYGEHKQRFNEKDRGLIDGAIEFINSEEFINDNSSWYDDTMGQPNIKWRFVLSNTELIMTDDSILKQIKLLGMKRIQTLFKFSEIIAQEVSSLTDQELYFYNVRQRFNELLGG